jgi:hypothetical protein
MPENLLPTAALDLLNFDTADAEAMAARGDPEGGYLILRRGLHRAAAARVEGWPWGEALVERYQQVIAGFLHRHGLSDQEEC